MKEINSDRIQEWHHQNKEDTLSGRWLPFSKIEPLLGALKKPFQVLKIGESVNQLPIYKVVIGTGKLRILIWSQMHGNESTGTKAVFDVFNFFSNPKEFSIVRDTILQECTLTFVPMLNPDGALAYTRLNAQEIDLNRDVISLKAPESKVLQDVLQKVNPQYCFNLHDQRTIFTVGDSKKPATLSFLAPSVGASRELTTGRKQTMSVIVAMNELLQKIIPGQIGRYTDVFYPTATGDNFQKVGHNTILIEAGHFKDDYQRETVRTLNFIALLKGLYFLASSKNKGDYKPYFEIPDNTKQYLDSIHTNIFLVEENKKVDVGVLLIEKLHNNVVIFEPEIQQIGNLNDYTANTFIDHKGKYVENRAALKLFLKK